MTVFIQATDLNGDGQTGTFYPAANFTVAALLSLPSTWWQGHGVIPIPSIWTHVESSLTTHITNPDGSGYWHTVYTYNDTTSLAYLGPESVMTYAPVTFNGTITYDSEFDPRPVGPIGLQGGNILQYWLLSDYEFKGSGVRDGFYAGGTGGVAFGYGGSDILEGGAGADRLYGGAGDDFITGSAGDSLIGGDGNDRLYLDLSTKTTALNFNVGLQQSALLTVTPGTTIQGFETFEATLGSGNDKIDLRGAVTTGTSFNNSYVNAHEGIDTAWVNAASRGVISSNGIEKVVVDLSGLTTRADVDSNGVMFDGFSLGLESSRITSIDLISGSGNDNIWGSIGNDKLNGGAGDDFITGSAGDSLIGGDGNDRLYLDLSTKTTALNFNVGLQQSALLTVTPGTTIQGFETFEATLGSGNDKIDLRGAVTTGTSFNNSYVNAHEGIDTAWVNAASRGVISSNGIEKVVVDLSGLTTRADVDSNGVMFDGFSLGLESSRITSIDLISGSGNDNIWGSIGNDKLNGGAGDDQIVGEFGKDVIVGGRGKDTLSGGTQADRFEYANGDSRLGAFDIILDFSKNATGLGDIFDFSSTLGVGGSTITATSQLASISASTGIATFAAASGLTLQDATRDIAASFTSSTDTAGEFAFFKVGGSGSYYLFVSDGLAGVGANDLVVQFQNIATISSISLTNGDIQILT